MELLTKILTASIDLFRQYGFKGITMDDIARRAGISKKTLYQHFANKHEIVTESVIWYKSHMTEQCQLLISDAENAIEAMVRLLAYMDQMYKQMNPVAVFEMQRYYPEAYSTFKDLLIEKDVEMVKQNIKQGMSEGFYRPDINAGLLARYRLESSLMILQPNLLVNNRSELLSVSLEIGEHFLYGIMTPEGQIQYRKYKEKYLNQSQNL